MIVVTGANGFIGAAVLRALAGREVVAVVGPGPSLPSGPRRRVVEVPLDASDAWPSVVAGATAVVHLAGPASVPESWREPHAYAAAHVGGTATVMAACRLAAVPRVVLVSSAEVYGRAPAMPVTEDAALRPASPYAAAKLGAEAMGRAFASAALTVACLRPFVVYGPGQRPSTVVAEVVAQARAGGDIRVRDPRPCRDFVHVDDVARGIVAATTAPLPEAFVPINLGTGEGCTIGALAEHALRIAGSGGTVSRRDPDRPLASDVATSIASTARAREVLGVSARVGLAEGLEPLIRAERT